MARTARALLGGLALVAWAGLAPAHAQSIPKSYQDKDAAIKERKNAWIVGLAGGIVEGTYFRFADDLRKALDDGDDMRVLPIVSRGAAANIEDLLYVRGIDIAVTQSDVFEYFRTEQKIANLENRVTYVLRFPIAEMHVIARKEIRSMEELRGKKVDFGRPQHQGGSLTAPIVFKRLGIEVEHVYNAAGGFGPGSYQPVINGEVAAAVRVVGKPVGHVAQIPANSGLHMVPIPFTKTFADYYALGEFTNVDYPNLVSPGERVDTIAVPVVLASYNWPKNHERYRKVERFVTRMFANWDKLRGPAFHPKWRDINFAATVPGWKRFPAAEEQLAKLAGGNVPTQQELSQDFQAFLGGREAQAVGSSPGDREELFRKFLQWRERKGAQAR